MSFHPVLATHQTPAALSTSADDRLLLLRATERFLAAYHAHPQLVAEQADWSIRILLRTPGYGVEGAPPDEGHAVAVQVVGGRGVHIKDRPQSCAADITVIAELEVLIDILELRKSPNEPYLFGELVVSGPEADFLRLDYVVSSLCLR